VQQTLATAQTMSVKPMPAAAQAAHTKLMPVLSAPAKAWVQSEAKVIAGRNLSPTAMVSMAQSDAKSRFAGQDVSNMAIEDLVMLVMMTISQDAQNDLKSQLAQMQQANQQKKAQRAAVSAQQQQQAAMKDSIKHHADQLGDLSQEQQLKMQMTMDRMSKAEQALTNIMKKSSDTSSQILQNLK
jgi:tRNA U34 5-carboxymethylaminomethyl modifying GTPase MnmE/TrmE